MSLLREEAVGSGLPEPLYDLRPPLCDVGDRQGEWLGLAGFVGRVGNVSKCSKGRKVEGARGARAVL